MYNLILGQDNGEEVALVMCYAIFVDSRIILNGALCRSESTWSMMNFDSLLGYLDILPVLFILRSLFSFGSPPV